MTESKVENAVVAIYDSHSAAEASIKVLQQAGLDMKRLSIVGKDVQTQEQALGFYTSGDRIMFWGTRAAFWGSLCGMLFGTAFFLIPGIGPLVVMGPLVGWLTGALEGAALGGAGGVLGAAMASIGIPKDSVVRYETAVKAGHFLVLVHGTTEMIVHARVVLGTTGATEVVAHQLTKLATRDDILKLLSDEELARVSSAETTVRLADGDEFLDLNALDQGVRRALGSAAPMGSVLAKGAVHEATWEKILIRLAEPPGA
jgi:hypothetical protein